MSYFAGSSDMTRRKPQNRTFPNHKTKPRRHVAHSPHMLMSLHRWDKKVNLAVGTLKPKIYIIHSKICDAPYICLSAHSSWGGSITCHCHQSAISALVAVPHSIVPAATKRQICHLVLRVGFSNGCKSRHVG